MSSVLDCQECGAKLEEYNFPVPGICDNCQEHEEPNDYVEEL